MANGDRTGFGAFLTGVESSQNNRRDLLEAQLARARQRTQDIQTQANLQGAGLELAPQDDPTFLQRLTGNVPAPKVQLSEAGRAARAAAKEKQAVDLAATKESTAASIATRNQAKKEFEVLNETVDGALLDPALKNKKVPFKFAIPLLEAKARAKVTGQKVKVPSQSQFQAATFGERALDSHNQLETLVQDPKFDPTSTFTAGRRFLLPKRLEGPNIQKLDQAERNFINAILRRESGAAIAPEEFESAEKQYFPRRGDSPEVLTQKKQNRERVINGLMREASTVPGVAPFTPTTFSPTTGEAFQSVFSNIKDAEAANLPKGTEIFIGGRRAIVE